ncbi:hypothetical protein, partial [Collinsella tanakaei]|uniref:hypothetical protein n=1 Tax=Collinsella tanakaei TaxID=626935 RepID=UPI002F93A8E8
LCTFVHRALALGRICGTWETRAAFFEADLAVQSSGAAHEACALLFRGNLGHCGNPLLIGAGSIR